MIKSFMLFSKPYRCGSAACCLKNLQIFKMGHFIPHHKSDDACYVTNFSVTSRKSYGVSLKLSFSFQLHTILKYMVRLRLQIEPHPKYLCSLKTWEEWLPHIEFAYNRVVNSTTSHALFELVYGFNPLTPFDLLPLLDVNFVLNYDGVSKARFVKGLHTKVCSHIERKVEQYAKKVNKGKVQKVFKKGDLVWVYLRNEIFPNLRKSKLLLRGNGPSKLFEKNK
ncbi:hypothetical protein CR513_34000, partial [Mucuna pruriens]